MQHCISKWKTGRYVPRELHVDMQCKMYKAHLAGLQNYGKLKANKLKQFQIDWFWYCVDYAGGTLEDDEPYQAVTWANQVSRDAADPDNDPEHAHACSSIVTKACLHQ
ncbi:hypothetical protein FRC06_001092 [Ceratobasidium sp. 370]|nr:hypothetical protein FRC06_001092 [Ceratobasidium sp. 370]